MKMKAFTAGILCLGIMMSLFSVGAFAQTAEADPNTAVEVLTSALEALEEPSESADYAEPLQPEPVMTEGVSSQSETGQITEPITLSGSVSHVNPLYDDAGSVPAPMDGGIMLLSEPPSFDEFEFWDAAEYFREMVKARAATVTFSFTTDEFDTWLMATDKDYQVAALTVVAGSLWEGALEHTGVPDEGDYLRWQYARWNVPTTMSIQGDNVTFTMTFNIVYYTTVSQEEAVSARVEEILEELNVRAMCDYEILCAIYDYLTENIQYDYIHKSDSTYTLKHSAYAALIQHTSVCQGYALALYRLALECGIDCRLIPGIGNGEGHGWNIAELDGQYYYLDATWDAGKTAYDYFLKGNGTFTGHYPDEYLGTEELLAEYVISEADYAPLMGDLNGDGMLTALDLVRMMKRATGADLVKIITLSDLNADGVVNVTDVVRLVSLCAEAEPINSRVLAESCIGRRVEELVEAIGEPIEKEYTLSTLVPAAEDGLLHYAWFDVVTIRYPDGTELILRVQDL